MKAQEKHTYAQLAGGVVHWVFTGVDLPEWSESDITVVDITGVSPAPDVGWIHDAGHFTNPFPAIAWADYQAQAQSALDASDRVALRCWKAGVVFPQEWKDYDKALREIMGQPQPATIPTALPAQPASYPAGT